MFIDNPEKTLDKLTLPGAVIRAKDVKDAGIHGSFLQRMVCEGRIIRCGRGLYRRTDVEPDDLLVLQIKYSKGIYSNETALFLHHYLDEEPSVLTITFPQGYHAESLNYGNIYAKHIIPSNFNLGVADVQTPKGNTVRAYNIERTICDLLRGQKADLELFETVFSKYLESDKPDIPLLEEYARKLRVYNKLKPYLDQYVGPTEETQENQSSSQETEADNDEIQFVTSPETDSEAEAFEENVAGY